jgi:hypothetical protein
VVLASALGPEATLPGAITINERTTVATGFAFAQFIQGTEISGNRYGVSNAVHMAANLANVVTGEIAEVLGTPPNGPDTSTGRTFDSLANMVALCTRRPNRCNEFLHAATPTGGTRPANTLAALAEIAKNPSAKPKRLFNLSQEVAIYRPGPARRPSGWTLFVRFTGTDSSR